MKSCVSAKYYHYIIIIKHIKATGSCKLNRWRLTGLPSTQREDGKGTASTERLGMDTIKDQVGKIGMAGRKKAIDELTIVSDLIII